MMIFEIIIPVVFRVVSRIPISTAMSLSRARWRLFSLSDYFFVLCTRASPDVPPYVYASVSRCVSLLYRLCLCWFGHNTAPRFCFGGICFFPSYVVRKSLNVDIE